MDLKFFLLIMVFLGGVLTCDIDHVCIFDYQSDIEIGRQNQQHVPNMKHEMVYRIKGEVQILNLWNTPKEDFLKINLSDFELYVLKKGTFVKQKSSLELSDSPFYIHRTGGEVKKVLIDHTEDIFLKNIKKGIASLLQYQITTTDVIEIDSSGKCNTSYVANGKDVKKTKKQCLFTREETRHSNSNKIRSASIVSSSYANYKILDGYLFQSVSAEDHVELSSNLWKTNSITVDSRTDLTFIKQQNSPMTEKFDSYNDVIELIKADYGGTVKEVEITSDLIRADSQNSKDELIKVVKAYVKNLKSEKLSKLVSASAFLRLLKHFRTATKESIKDVLQDKKLKSVLPQLLDIVAFTETPAAIEAAFEVLDFTSTKQYDNIERYLLSLSLTNHPKEDIIRRILKVFDTTKLNTKIEASLVSTLGALTKTYIHRYNSPTETTTLVYQFFDKRINACKEEKCFLTYLRGLRNSGLPNTLPTLITIINKGGKPAHEALLALKNANIGNFQKECEKLSKQVLYQLKSKQESSARITAAELLLLCHSDEKALQHLLSSLSEQHDFETSTLITAKIMDEMEHNENFRLKVLKLLSSKEVKHYYVLSQNGTSASFTKPLYVSPHASAFYYVLMELAKDGLVKRSNFDVDLQTHDDKFKFLSVGMFASGLGNLMGGSSGDDSPTAALELSIFGVALRPYVLFEGSSELMGHVWSGTGSEPTPVLQGNFLLVDCNKIVVLQNGLVVDLNLQGAVSTDLSASIQISLWNRNSKSLVKNGVAVLFSGSAAIKSNIITMEEELSFKGQAALEFLTHSEFYEEPYKMCVQMIQPSFDLWVNRKRQLQIPEQKYTYNGSKRTKYIIPAKSYSLHHKNNELCSQMFSGS